MGCLLGCFGRPKNRRRQRRKEPRLNKSCEGSTKDVHLNLRVSNIEEVPKDDRLNFRVPAVEEVTKVSVIPTIDICDNKAEEKNSPSPSRKRVTFDTKVKTYEHMAVEESIELFEDKNKNKKEEMEPEKLKLARCSSEASDVTSNSSGSYPPSHRYQNCRDSDDEEDDVTDCEESDLDDIDDDDDGGLLDEDYYNDDDDDYDDKLHSWDNKVYTEEIADNVLDIDKSNATARDRSGYVNAVLNPIENLTQWKAVKSKGRTIQTQFRKEKANLISNQEHKLNSSFSLEEPRVDELPSFSFKQKSRDETKKQSTQEVAVDASLSTWLSTSQTTTSGCSSVSMSGKKKSSKPVQSYDERPILGALTSEEIKQFSATNSPRKSPSRSPESPIIGTVGGYWNSHTMATRRYREVSSS